MRHACWSKPGPACPVLIDFPVVIERNVASQGRPQMNQQASWQSQWAKMSRKTSEITYSSMETTISLGLWHRNCNNMGYCCIMWSYLPPEEIMQKHLGYICEKASGCKKQHFMSKWHIINKFYFTFPWVFSYCIKWERSKDTSFKVLSLWGCTGWWHESMQNLSVEL